jgi:hypothetical protein
MSNLLKSALFGAIVVVSMAAMPLGNEAFSQSKLSDAEVQSYRTEAQQLLADKKTEAALKKIEQVIIARPTDLSARFFRSQILTSLGRGAEIKAELELMLTLRISEADKAKARELIAAIDKQGRKFSGSITVKAGIGYADNVNSWPKGGEKTQNGAQYPLPDPIYQKLKPVSDRVSDGTATFAGSYFLTDDRNLKANFNLMGRVKEGGDTVHLNQRYYSARVGLEYQLSNGMTVKANTSSASLDRVNQHKTKDVTTDLDISSYDAELSQKFGKYTVGYRFASSTNKNSKLKTAKLSDSTTTTNSLYVGGAVGKTMYARATISASQARSDHSNDTAANLLKAKERVNKDTDSISVLLVKVLPKKQRIVATASYSNGDYLAAEVAAGKKRSDETQSYSFGYSVDGGTIWSKLEDIKFGFDTTYSKTDSNQSSARIHSRTFMLSASKKFDL